MKNLAGILLLIIFILMAGCENQQNYQEVTKINKDGSCQREFSGQADSSFMVGKTDDSNPFPVLIDSTWKVSWTYSLPAGKRIYSHTWPLKRWKWDPDTTKHLSLNAIISKEYPSTEAMSETFRYNHSSWDSIVPKVKFKKKFRWFFTFFEYQETFPKYNPLKMVPVEKYLTKDEIKTYAGDNPKFSPRLNGMEIRDLLNAIDIKKENWINENFFEAYYKITADNLASIKGISIDPIRFGSLKDSVYHTFKDKLDREPKSFMENLDKFYKIKIFETLPDSSKEMVELTRFEKRFEKPFSENLNYNLLLPGKLVETNSNQINGDTATWKVDAYRFYLIDFEMHAESRVANIWAFIVSGIFVLAVAFSFMIRK